jgi:hypothetical protein
MRARVACTLTLAALAAVAAGCGSSSSAKQATTTTPGGQRGARFEALSKCLQSKGFKPPSRARQPGAGRPPGLNLQDPKFRQAFQACRTQVFGNSGPPGGPPGGGPPGGGPPGGGAPYGAPQGQGGGTFQ